MELLKISLLFAITAVAEIVGCYLPWLVLRQGSSCGCSCLPHWRWPWHGCTSLMAWPWSARPSLRYSQQQVRKVLAGLHAADRRRVAVRLHEFAPPTNARISPA